MYTKCQNDLAKEELLSLELSPAKLLLGVPIALNQILNDLLKHDVSLHASHDVVHVFADLMLFLLGEELILRTAIHVLFERDGIM